MLIVQIFVQIIMYMHYMHYICGSYQSQASKTTTYNKQLIY